MTQAVSIGKTLLLVFISTVLGQLVTYGSGIFDIGAGEWKGIAAAGIAAIIAFAYNYLIPQDERYGVGAK
jgi:hypothetical protein